MKKIPLDILQEKARLLTQQALSKCVIPETVTSDKLFIEVKFEGDFRTFELYQSNGGAPETDVLISRIKLNIFTGNGDVETFLQHC